MKRAGEGVGLGLLVLIIVGVLAFVGLGVAVFSSWLGGESAKLTLKGKETQTIYQVNNSLPNYESFYNDCRAVVGYTEKIAQAKEELVGREKLYDKDSDPFGHELDAINRLRQSVRGLENQRTDVAQGYNARSSQSTRAIFKASDLPYTIDPPYAEIACGTPKEPGR